MSDYKNFTVFVGWSGRKEIARRLSGFLGSFFGGCLTVNFSEYIPGGEVWATELNEFLSTATFGLMCVTPSSRPAWLLYESGALSLSTAQDGTKERPRIVPLLFGVDTASLREDFGPLSHYQAVTFEKDASFKKKFWNLMGDINNLSEERQEAYRREHEDALMQTQYLTAGRFDSQFNAYYPPFERDIRCLMAADTMDAHLKELEEDRFCKPAGKAAFLSTGREFTELIRLEPPEVAQQYLIGRIQPTLDTVMKENGYPPVLRALAGDVDFLNDWLCKK